MSYIIGCYFCRPRINRLCELKRDLHFVIVEDIDRAVEAVGKIEQISRACCRREFEQRFTDRQMAEDYIRIYQQLLSRSSTQAAA